MKNQSGFTLIELIMVIVIIGVLAAVAVAKFTDLSDGAGAAKCKANQATVEAAVDIAYADSAIAGNAQFPTALVGTMFRDGSIPTCPFDGANIGYTAADGTASCPTSQPTHAR